LVGIIPISARQTFLRVLLAGFLLFPALMVDMAAGQVPLITHRAEVFFGIDNNMVQITDQLVIPPGIDHLRIGQGFKVEIIKGSGSTPAVPGSSISQAEDDDGPFQRVDLGSLGLAEVGGDLTVVYKGTFRESVDDVVFSRENVGGEIIATISEEGIYLSSQAEWLPWSENTMATYDLKIDTPSGFETVTQGRRTEHTVGNDRLRTRWVADNPSDGINLIANRYFVHEEPVREGVVSYTFFLEDDARLRATYMERTQAYITMYEEMIGPYPYTKFATVENWFPTGYGMPSYTLLGGQVLRLPFIPTTSFGHEIAHNWWGNSVFVDMDEGNWCEGLTVYCADYHYKALESDDASREYRRTLLKNYAAYVKDPSQDFPLSEFMSRHSGATRAVGYGKSMMVFHMADRAIGRENFLAGLRQVAAEHHYTKASWSDFMTAFAEAGNRDLASFQEQWLTRTGAPVLTLDEVDFREDEVVFTLGQDEPTYTLEIPVVLTTATGTEEHVVVLDRPSRVFTIKTGGVVKLAVDPDCHLFRRLHSAEIEPTISQVLADDDPAFVIQGAAPDMTAAARKFAAEFSEKEEFPFQEDGALPNGGHASIVINPEDTLLKQIAPTNLVVSGTTLFLAGKRYSLKEYDLVFAAWDPDDSEVTDLVILSDSTHRLEALARRVGHYGKYSWLLLPVGQGKVLRGNWATGDSPLMAVK
jgi:aminopeptidase N